MNRDRPTARRGPTFVIDSRGDVYRTDEEPEPIPDDTVRWSYLRTFVIPTRDEAEEMEP